VSLTAMVLTPVKTAAPPVPNTQKRCQHRRVAGWRTAAPRPSPPRLPSVHFAVDAAAYVWWVEQAVTGSQPPPNYPPPQPPLS
jgi:hypothetical protein